MNEYEHNTHKCPLLGCARCQEIECAIYDGTACGLASLSFTMDQIPMWLESIQESLSIIATSLNCIADKEG